jgi:hypothetical protein
VVRGFGALDWQVFLSELPRTLPADRILELDQKFGFLRSKNAEIRINWLVIAAASDYEPAFSSLRTALTTIGRMKYLRPLYLALLAGSARTQALAEEAFEAAKAGYHPVSRTMIEGLLRAPKRPSA